MRKLFLMLAMALGAGAAQAEWYYSEEFHTDFWRDSPADDKSTAVQYVDCNGLRSMQVAQQCMRQDWMTHGVNLTMVKGHAVNTSGLRGKVAARVAASRPGSGSQKGRAGTSYNYQTSDAHQRWVQQKWERQEAARQADAEKKRQAAIAQKIADDNRAAAVEAATNAALQQRTNQAIARDYYNANEGAAAAQQRARRAVRRVGPQYAAQRPRSTGAAKARTLRGQNKPRRVMHPQRRNTARPALPAVQRRPCIDPERAAMIRKALFVREELRRKAAQERLAQKRREAQRRAMAYKGFTLDPNAVPTTGNDWDSPDVGPGPLAPPPVTAVKPPVTEDQRMQQLLDEMLP